MLYFLYWKRHIHYTLLLKLVLDPVIELSDVRDKEWGKTYGTSFKLQECRDYFQASSKDIIITNPKDLNITTFAATKGANGIPP